MIHQIGTGLVRFSREPQFLLETSSPLITVEVSDYPTLDFLGFDEHGDMRLNPSNELFPYSVHVYPEQLPSQFSSLDWGSSNLVLSEDLSPSPKCYRWIRWYDQRPASEYGDHWGKYMVGHCLPEEVNKTRWLYCLLDDKFFAYPLANFPEDFDDIWIYEDEESDERESW